MRKVVVNTTPLIALSYVGHLDILKKLSVTGTLGIKQVGEA